MTPTDLRLAICHARPQYVSRIRINRAAKEHPNLRSVTIEHLGCFYWADLDGDLAKEVRGIVLLIDDLVREIEDGNSKS